MKFNDYAWEQLVNAYLTKSTLIISGSNNLSQEFVTEGKIAPIRASELYPNYEYPNDIMIGLESDFLILEMGKKTENELRTPYSATFFTDMYQDDYENFLIKEIKLKKTGKTIFVNKDYEDYREYNRVTLTTYGKQLLQQGITPGTMDGKCQQLTNHIGKPINVLGQTGVLFFVDSTYKSEILLHILSFDELKHIYIPRNSTIVEGKNLIKIKEAEKHSSFEDFLINYSRRKKW